MKVQETLLSTAIMKSQCLLILVLKKILRPTIMRISKHYFLSISFLKKTKKSTLFVYFVVIFALYLLIFYLALKLKKILFIISFFFFAHNLVIPAVCMFARTPWLSVYIIKQILKYYQTANSGKFSKYKK